MALREKVAIAVLTIIVFQITSKYCMPRSFKIPSKLLKTRKYSPPKYSVFKEQQAPVIPICKAFKFPETEYPKPPRTFLEPCYTKYKATETVNNNSNTMCKCPKSSKIMHTIKADKKKQNNNNTRLLESNKSAPLSYCFNGRFPETEYPLNIAETWSPKYWTQLPNTDMKKCSTPICSQDTENIIKTTNTAIEKALDALLRSQQTSSLLADICPLNSQAKTEFLISDQGNATLVTHSTSTPIVPQASDIRDLEQNTPNNDKSACINASKSNGRDSAITDGLPNNSIIPSLGESNSKNENDLPVITTDSSTKLVPSGESSLSNESNEAPVHTDLSSIEALLSPVIPTDYIEPVILANDSLSTINSIENINVSPVTPAVPELDHSDAVSEFPEKRDPSADSVVSDSNIPKSNSVSSLSTLDADSSVQHYIDKTTTETTIPNTSEFIAPMTPLNPEKDNLQQGLSVSESNSLPLISTTPNYDKSIISEVDSSPSIPSEPTQKRGDLPSESVVKETCDAHLITAMSPTMSTDPDTNDSFIDSKTLANGDSSLESVLYTNDSHTSLAYPITDTPGEFSEGADATLPEIPSIPQHSTIPDTSGSNNEHNILNKDDAPLDMTKTNTDDFPAISYADTATNDIYVPSATVENARKSSSLSESSANVTPNTMEIQEYDYTTMSPFYNDLEVDSLNYDPEKETWILDPNDKEYLIVW